LLTFWLLSQDRRGELWRIEQPCREIDGPRCYGVFLKVAVIG